MNYVVGCVVTLLALAGWVYARYEFDRAEVTARLLRDSHVATTACGPIEYSEVGSGPAVLAIHGAGGGYPQMAEFGDTLAPAGFRVVAVSRFGYLQTPSPIHADVKEQAAAHACLLDSLGITTAAVFGVSAGAPSSIQFCLDFPARCSALVLLVPAAFPPGTTTKDTTPPSPYMSFVLDHVLGSDFLIWTVTRVAPRMLNEAPRSKLRGITELKHVELPEIIAGLSLPLHIPLDCLPVRSLSYRGHIVPIGPKFSTPQHSFDGRLSAKDFPGRDALKYLYNPPRRHFRMGTAEEMDVILVRPNRFHLDRKSFCNLCRRVLNNRGHFLIQQRLAVFHRKHNMVVDLPCTVRPLANLIVPLIRHAPEGTRETDPRSKLRGITS